MAGLNQISSRETLLVLPVLNEKLNLEILLPHLISLNPLLSIVIVDDNSIDGTEDYLDKLRSSCPNVFYLRRKEKLGIGDAHLTGISFGIEKGFRYVITMDADLTHRV